jgi:ABC-type antimicrobial peptide transport system permease subunit
VIITSATLQLAIYARREEIEIQKLVGATDRFVKAPFLIEGLLQGALGAAVAVAFGYLFYTPSALTPFFVLIFFLGIGGANFALYTLWIPEQYTTECRGSAIGFTSSVGRFVGVAMVFIVGAGIQRYGSLGVPVALTAAAFDLGLLVLPAAKETKGEPLPA